MPCPDNFTSPKIDAKNRGGIIRVIRERLSDENTDKSPVRIARVIVIRGRARLPESNFRAGTVKISRRTIIRRHGAYASAQTKTPFSSTRAYAIYMYFVVLIMC